MQEIAALAAARAISIIIDIYSISRTANRCDMPYPPYVGSDPNIIANEQAFIDLWALIANAMKTYGNVLFDLFNEPCGNYRTDSNWFTTDYNAMLNTFQKCIARIRQITSLPIIVQWGYQIGVDLAGPWTWAPSVKLPVFADDPRVQGTNIIYSFHWYEDNPQRNQQKTNSAADIAAYLSWSGVDDVARRKTVLCSEFGGVVLDEFAMTWMNNALDALISRGISVLSWVWTAPWMAQHGDELIATAPGFLLTDKGVAFVQKLGGIISPPAVYTCTICGAAFSTQAELDAHMAAVHWPSGVTYVLDVWSVLGGTTSPTGIHEIIAGTLITITATAAAGYSFGGWQVVIGTELTNYPATVNPLTLTVAAATTVMPLFVLVPVPPTCATGYHWDDTVKACVQDAQPSGNNVAAGLAVLTLLGVGAVYVATRKKR